MGSDYSFELNSMNTYAPQFFGPNNLFLGSVFYHASESIFTFLAYQRITL